MRTNSRHADITEDLFLPVDGVARCARYAFGPNRLHLCGPDMNAEVLAYLDAGVTDLGLSNILQKFKTLAPYLSTIARANNIKDPFDDRVVEAYWIGNELLDIISPKTFYTHLVDTLRLHQRLHRRAMECVREKLIAGARMHHSFHVFNVWQRTGNTQIEHTVESMDKCRVSCGRVVAVHGSTISVLRQPLVLRRGKLALDAPRLETIKRRLDDCSVLSTVQPHDVISIHWDMPCEVLTHHQMENLEKYTNASLALANRTL